jgi:hypothetical protein
VFSVREAKTRRATPVIGLEVQANQTSGSSVLTGKPSGKRISKNIEHGPGKVQQNALTLPNSIPGFALPARVTKKQDE